MGPEKVGKWLENGFENGIWSKNGRKRVGKWSENGRKMGGREARKRSEKGPKKVLTFSAKKWKIPVRFLVYQI